MGDCESRNDGEGDEAERDVRASKVAAVERSLMAAGGLHRIEVGLGIRQRCP